MEGKGCHSDGFVQKSCVGCRHRQRPSDGRCASRFATGARLCFVPAGRDCVGHNRCNLPLFFRVQSNEIRKPAGPDGNQPLEITPFSPSRNTIGRRYWFGGPYSASEGRNKSLATQFRQGTLDKINKSIGRIGPSGTCYCSGFSKKRIKDKNYRRRFRGMKNIQYRDIAR